MFDEYNDILHQKHDDLKFYFEKNLRMPTQVRARAGTPTPSDNYLNTTVLSGIGRHRPDGIVRHRYKMWCREGGDTLGIVARAKSDLSCIPRYVDNKGLLLETTVLQGLGQWFGWIDCIRGGLTRPRDSLKLAASPRPAVRGQGTGGMKGPT